MADEQNDDLRDVQAEEENRGTRRRKFDAEERRKSRVMRQGVMKAYRDRDEVALKIALLSAGWSEESPEFAEALRKFRDAISRLPTK
jgi:hypothetical protein